jgi:hypothetical protein
LRAVWLLAVVAMPGPALAQPADPRADYITRFAGYVRWPATVQPGAGDPFRLCIIGIDPFGAAIDRAAGAARIDGRPIAVRRLPNAEGASACHLAFVRGAHPSETLGLLDALRPLPVLTITDERFGPHRGMMHFVNSGGRLRFFVDEAAAAERGLAVSSRLLALALGVRQRRE